MPTGHTPARLPRASPLFVARFLTVGDEVEFSPDLSVGCRTELRVIRSGRTRPRDLYLAPIGYVTQPKLDKREEPYLRGEIPAGSLGVQAVHVPAPAVRDYFYRGDRNRSWADSPTLYQILGVTPTATLTDLRLAFKIRRLELGDAPSAREAGDLERAFNLLMQPDVRACYDALLRDPEAPVLFPYGGFGSLLIAGELARDRRVFFGLRVVSFLPSIGSRGFRAPMRRIDFQDSHAVLKDARRRILVQLDSVILPVGFDATWNQWKHLLGAKIGIDAACLATGKYRFDSGDWSLITWHTALPSRTQVSLAAETRNQIRLAQATWHRFGVYSAALEDIRARVLREPVERRELDRLCAELGIPSDFDIAQISWKPDYDRFFYEQLRKRSRKMYLFREEYIFETERAIVVEVPELGHATYVFAKSENPDAFVRAYARASRDDIRKNRDGIAERLRFIGRVMHGRNPRTWLQELRRRIGEPVDYAAVVSA